MGDEPESDADSPEQSPEHDESPDPSPTSNDTSASSTTAVDLDGVTDDADSDDTGDSDVSEELADEREASSDEADENAEPPLQPEAEGDASLLDDFEPAEPVAPRDWDADTDSSDDTSATDPALQPDEKPADGVDDAAFEEDDNLPNGFEDDAHDTFEGGAHDTVGEGSSAEGFADDFDDEFTSDFDDDDFGGFADGPETDNEMPLADHIEEMVRRLAVVFIVGGAVALAVFGLGEVLRYVPSTIDIINFLWNRHIPGAGQPGNETLRPHVYGPLELIFTKLKVAGLAGVVVGLPVFVYESYLFMRPGLYENERKYYLASVPTSLILAVIGVAFAHFVVLPSIFSYFTSYTEGTALIAFGLAETFNLILILMGYMAIVFQIPLFIMLAIMMNLVTRNWLENKRLIFWGSFLGLAFLVSPDPTGMAPIIIAITMVVLFEGTLALLRWTGN